MAKEKIMIFMAGFFVCFYTIFAQLSEAPPQNPVATLSAIFPELLNETKKRIIYGIDGREDARLHYLNFSTGIAGLFYKESAPVNGPPRVGYYTRSYGDGCEGPLCNSERFYGEPQGPWCSAFLISDSLLMSAGHCVAAPGDLRFVFDFDREDLRETRDCAVIHRAVNTETLDYAIFELDRPIDAKRRHIFPLASAAPSVGAQLLLIGHPMGLPVKADATAHLKGVSSTFLAADLDAYAGNSGSPVIVKNTGEVAGILVLGFADYKESSAGCCQSNWCSSTTGCSGLFELATRVDVLQSAIFAQI